MQRQSHCLAHNRPGFSLPKTGNRRDDGAKSPLIISAPKPSYPKSLYSAYIVQANVLLIAIQPLYGVFSAKSRLMLALSFPFTLPHFTQITHITFTTYTSSPTYGHTSPCNVACQSGAEIENRSHSCLYQW
jgi:hypothetical protein